MNTRLEIILGCMFSGKSTELLRRCKRYRAIGKNVLLINHVNDIRTTNKIKTHCNSTENAIKISKLVDLINENDESFKNAEVIGIDEAQFFDDLYLFVTMIEKFNKIIIIAGLDGDSNRKPFGQILDCIPYCDEVVKLTALDMMDKDGSLAIFTKRIVDDKTQILVGSTEYFMAVSRKNYLKN